jgi:hypothetical protein
MDVALEVLNSQYTPDGVSTTVRWWNIHGNRYFGTPPFLIYYSSLNMPEDEFKKLTPYIVTTGEHL